MPTSFRHGCCPSEHHRLPRRALLHVGGLTLLGTSLADLLRLEAEAAQRPRPRAARAKSVVFIFQAGGPSQFETWDPKPDAPAEIRGEYRPIGTKVAGLQVCEYLPNLAARADRFSIVRTMHHPADPRFRNEHSASQYLVQTGSLALPPGEDTSTIAVARPRVFEWPSIASLLAYSASAPSPAGLPPSILIPRSGGDGPGIRPGMLGARYGPWSLVVAPQCRAPDAAGSCPNCFSHDQPDDPARAPGKGPKAWWDNSSCRDAEFSLPDLGTPAGLTVSRIEARRSLLDRVDRFRRDLDGTPSVRDLDIYRQQALELMLAQRGRDNPFDLKQEPERVRERYGREEWGNAFLLARRLVEAGVRVVQVNLRGWDTHQNAFRDLKGKILPSLDHCLSGFLDDLQERGLLEETLVVMCGEMGRTPVISPISPNGVNAAGVPFTPGRHHWGDVFPCFFAGGGIRPGQVVGKTDPTGGHPDSEAFTPADLAATVFHLMGIGPDAEFHDPEGRPYRVYLGEPIRGVL
jgi:hypothetical protein